LRNLFFTMFMFLTFFVQPAYAQDADEVTTPEPEVATEVVVVETPVLDAALKVVDPNAVKPITEVIGTEVVEEEVAEEAGIEDAALPKTDEEAGALLGQIFESAQQGHWMVFAGGVMLMLMWVFNRLGLAAKIGRQYIGWVTVGLSTLVAIAVSMATGSSILEGLQLGLLNGGLAVALWELVAKRLTKNKSDGTPRVLDVEENSIATA